MRPHRAIATALAWFLLCAGRNAGNAADDVAAVDYLSQIKPILARHCIACHGAVKPRGELRLDTAALMFKGGKEGPAVIPGNSAESPLILAVKGEGSGERMPLKRAALTEPEIELLARWVDQGAKAPTGETPDTGDRNRHWAFRPPLRPSPPGTVEANSDRNPVDRFIGEKLRARGLRPSPEADRVTLIRRVTLDLIGLPPSPEEIATFVADTRPHAYDRLVDRLLTSPRFGERWARPWLDQARYADSNGFNIDAPRSIWKYREWLISALNADMPFDEFTIDQIAGDLRPGATFAQRTATGFHRNTPINQEGGIDVEQFRIESVIDRVNTTGTVFLGLTIGCAQCHDHKYDPFTTREYYRLFAFLNNVDEPDLELASPAELAYRDGVKAEIEAFFVGLEKRYSDLDDREQRWEASTDLAFKQAQGIVARVAFDAPRSKRTVEQKRALVELMLAGEPAWRGEHHALARLRARQPSFLTTMVVQERATAPRISHIHVGGDFTRKGDVVTPGVPAILHPLSTALSPGSPADRMDLARWLVDRRNPLTARVIVNRIWQAEFGRGLVETDNDFGTQGSPPSHPELLDWLACELMERDWSLKALHRVIVTSAAYRQSSRVRAEGMSADPENRLLWRQSRLRLEAELMRDEALACSGLLAERIGGPSVFPPQPDGVMTLGQMRREWKTDTGPNRYRRGLYTYFWRATPYPMLTTFDAPGGVQACTRRLRSNTPLQALTLLNDPAYVEIAEALAARILRESAGDDPDSRRIDRAYLLCLGRKPLPRESDIVERLLTRERESTAATEASAAVERRAWTAVARVLLNLDEFMTRE